MRKKLLVRKIRRKRKITTFYGPKDTRFNVAFNRPSFGAPGLDLVGPHVNFGMTERCVELEKSGKVMELKRVEY